MTRVAVLGGTGFLGSKVVDALRGVAGVEVAAASRRSAVCVDVTKPASYSALAPFDVVVDLSDTVSNPPDALVAWCLEQGKTVLEATSDAPCVERLHKAHSGRTTGRLVLGGGIFTGVSNLLARDVAKRSGTPKELSLGIASSPFSGAGNGTVALMTSAMAVPCVTYQDGHRKDVEGIRRGPGMEFRGTLRPTVQMSLAEPYMLHCSTGAPTVAVHFAPKPGPLAAAFTVLPIWLLKAGWYQAFMRVYFTLLRTVLLRSTPTRVDLVAQANGTNAHVRRSVSAPDGMETAGYLLAAMAEGVGGSNTWTGARFVDDVLELEPVAQRANVLAGKVVLEVGPVEDAVVLVRHG